MITLNNSLLQKNSIQLLGLGDLPVERQEAVIQKITELVEKRVVLRILEGLTEEQKEKAADVLENGSDDEKNEFLLSVADLQTIITEEIIAAKQELLDDVGALEI